MFSTHRGKEQFLQHRFLSLVNESESAGLTGKCEFKPDPEAQTQNLPLCASHLSSRKTDSCLTLAEMTPPPPAPQIICVSEKLTATTGPCSRPTSAAAKRLGPRNESHGSAGLDSTVQH